MTLLKCQRVYLGKSEKTQTNKTQNRKKTLLRLAHSALSTNHMYNKNRHIYGGKYRKVHNQIYN